MSASQTMELPLNIIAAFDLHHVDPKYYPTAYQALASLGLLRQSQGRTFPATTVVGAMSVTTCQQAYTAIDSALQKATGKSCNVIVAEYKTYFF